MDSLPDFSQYNYQIERELGANRAGGRVTYLATSLETQRQVVIKQFQFARSSVSWGDYDAFTQEIQVLKGLQHQGIPQYLGSFPHDQGFCMVQEYKPAQSLAERRSFSPDAIRQIAVAMLEILVYLQNRIPPLIHRDIKPANILVDEDLQVYLVDFGFARIGDGEVGLSSVVKGTLGFMPPEQLFNRQLTEASDLYGLGMTLICLLTNTPADEVGTLVDISYRVDLKHLKAKTSPRWLKWLERMVEPRVSERFANATEALAALPEHSLRQPEVQCSETEVSLLAQAKGEVLQHSIQLKNVVPETCLKGHWEVAAHTSDLPTSEGAHPWIRFFPEDFEGNQIKTQIQVQTRKLMTGKHYTRQLILRTNAFPSIYSFILHVQTAPLPIRTIAFPYGKLGILLTACGILSWIFAAILPIELATDGHGSTLGLAAMFGCILGLKLAGWILLESGMRLGGQAIAVEGFALLLLLLIFSVVNGIAQIDVFLFGVLVGVGIFGGALLGIANGTMINLLSGKGFKSTFSVIVPTAASIFAVLLGLSRGLMVFNPWFLAGMLLSSLTVSGFLIRDNLQRSQAIAAYRNAEKRLISS